MLNTYWDSILYRVERQRHHGGLGRLFTDVQETVIINMVLANNAIRIREISEHILNNDTIFNNINAVSLSTIQRILQRHQVTMKQLYKVPFERNSDRVKNLRQDFVEVCMQHYFQYFRHTIFTHLYILLSVTESIGDGCPCNSPWTGIISICTLKNKGASKDSSSDALEEPFLGPQEPFSQRFFKEPFLPYLFII